MVPPIHHFPKAPINHDPRILPSGDHGDGFPLSSGDWYVPCEDVSTKGVTTAVKSPKLRKMWDGV